MLAIQAEEVRASHLPVLLVHPCLRVLAVSPAVRRLLGHGDGRGELEGAAVDEVLRVVRVAEPDLRRVLEDAAGGARSRWSSFAPALAAMCWVVTKCWYR